MLDGARSPMADTHTIPVICSPGQPRHTHPYREPTHTYLPLHLSCPLGVCVCGSYLSISSHQKAVVKIQEPQDTLTLTLPPLPPPLSTRTPHRAVLLLWPSSQRRAREAAGRVGFKVRTRFQDRSNSWSGGPVVSLQ